MKKSVQKPNQTPNLLVELTNRKMEAQKSGMPSGGFGKFQPNKSRNENNSAIGPHWGPRKGN